MLLRWILGKLGKPLGKQMGFGIKVGQLIVNCIKGLLGPSPLRITGTIAGFLVGQLGWEAELAIYVVRIIMRKVYLDSKLRTELHAGHGLTLPSALILHIARHCGVDGDAVRSRMVLYFLDGVCVCVCVSTGIYFLVGPFHHLVQARTKVLALDKDIRQDIGKDPSLVLLLGIAAILHVPEEIHSPAGLLLMLPVYFLAIPSTMLLLVWRARVWGRGAARKAVEHHAGLIFVHIMKELEVKDGRIYRTYRTSDGTFDAASCLKDFYVSPEATKVLDLLVDLCMPWQRGGSSFDAALGSWAHDIHSWEKDKLFAVAVQIWNDGRVRMRKDIICFCLI
ncbi:hypothetical protein DUNSADRAFT_14985 [Dunaliella salina]|uniref:Uncharacterized protein n=1 Tax=Dunaliella salina TaxID=3046 RepID=A0ABQ7H271_DUNSA|nr:hypothetical protein DUNSADRAFT_14985 [Dunaliella salina]KAF5840962.1 hypothetical protein DUNSADRAFT_14985 [Dunaliella salina]|eukprot:KAF5840961.1 hypothetical protein DUNSADRAFT_14985 [Dunaliella salina]